MQHLVNSCEAPSTVLRTSLKFSAETCNIVSGIHKPITHRWNLLSTRRVLVLVFEAELRPGPLSFLRQPHPHPSSSTSKPADV